MNMLGFAWQQILQMVPHAFLTLFMNPVLYIGTIIIIWDLVRNTRAERRFFGVRLTRVVVPQVIRYAKAICVGLVLTLLALILHIEVRVGELFIVGGISILLGLIRLRFASTIYAASVFVVFAAAAHKFPSMNVPFLAKDWHYLALTHLDSWLQILALLFLAQLLLVAWSRDRGAAPALVASKRGRKLGAMVIQWSFIVPFGVFIPGQMNLPSIFNHFNWLAIIGTVSLAAMPAVLGWHGVVSTMTPKRVASQIVFHSGLCAVLLTGLVALINHTNVNSLLISVSASVIAVVIPELHIWYVKRSELKRQPICQPNEDGVAVLYTMPGSVAEQIGLKMGEIITHVNQVPVHSEYDLHFALDQNPAYAKLRVVDSRGEIRIVGKPVYEGERHQLGTILVSESLNAPLYHKRPIGLLQTLYLQLKPSNEYPSQTLIISESSHDASPPVS